MKLRLALLASLLAASCSGDAAENADAGPDSIAADAATSGLSAEGYCESIVDSFCKFYLRCGRMAVANMEECRPAFLESCNGRYEPRYVDLERAGLLELNPEGVAACAAHLETVSCEEQFFELSGPCRDIWTGKVAAGGACGVDVESFVCESGTECVIAPNLCGTCEPLLSAGDSCTDPSTTCGVEGYCENDLCAARIPTGDGCGAMDRCMATASCVDGTCVGPTFVEVGQACDFSRRCPYLSRCDAGFCVATSLVGGDCAGDIDCATGYCGDGGKCVPLALEGDACTAPNRCATGLCAGTCQPLPDACF